MIISLISSLARRGPVVRWIERFQTPREIDFTSTVEGGGWAQSDKSGLALIVLSYEKVIYIKHALR